VPFYSRIKKQVEYQWDVAVNYGTLKITTEKRPTNKQANKQTNKKQGMLSLKRRRFDVS